MSIHHRHEQEPGPERMTEMLAALFFFVATIVAFGFVIAFGVN